MWADVLKIDEAVISVNRSFFELGGHSLRAIGLTNSIFKQFNVKITLRELFKLENISNLSKFISEAERTGHAPIAKAPEKTYYALSATQKGMYFLHEYDKASLVYNMPVVLRLDGMLDKERLVYAFNGLVARHDIFRTSFRMSDVEPVQVIHKAIDFKVAYFVAREEDVRSIMEKNIRPFDLQQAPLIRVCLVRVSEERHFLLVDTHHIVMDGSSLGILTKEFVALYKGVTLPDVTLQYRDYTEWEQTADRQVEMKNQQKFWIDEFADGIPKLDLPADLERPLIRTYEGSSVGFTIDKEQTDKLRSLAEKEGATMFIVLLSAFNILLSKLSGQKDIVVGTSSAGRQHDDLKNVVGLFLETIPLRNHPEDNLSFYAFLRDVRDRTLRCFDNRYFPYEDVFGALQIDR